MRAGQHLVIVLPRAETLITEEADDEATGLDRPSDAPAPAEMPNARHPAARPRRRLGVIWPACRHLHREGPRRAALGASCWPLGAGTGSWPTSIAAGIDVTLASAPSEDLLALADAARYRRRVDLARAALLAQRRRFPGSARALDALFLLGRVEELSPDGSARAIAFYDDYLARAPRGGYAAEALGRKMILSNDVGGPSKARRSPTSICVGSPGEATRVQRARWATCRRASWFAWRSRCCWRRSPVCGGPAWTRPR